MNKIVLILTRYGNFVLEFAKRYLLGQVIKRADTHQVPVNSGSFVVSLKAHAVKFHFLMQDLTVNFTALLELWRHSQEHIAAARNC